MAFVVWLLLVLINMQSWGESTFIQQVPCFFIFGDSLVDNGNNNQLKTLAKANYPPYGTDFPQGPTGRFTNGRNFADVLAELLGFHSFIPPFATTRGDDIIKGVNYASGSAGILPETGKHLGENVNLETQLVNFNVTKSRICNMVGNDHLGKCLYLFVIGSNDYINNYFQPDHYNTSKAHNPQQYAEILVQQYCKHLRKLYDLGARKVAISAVGSLGCIPAVMASSPSGSNCISPMNDAVELFNKHLQHLVSDLNQNLTDAQFTYIGITELKATQILPEPGIKAVSTPCCKVSNVGLCTLGQTPCPVRDLSIFYDAYHPTEIVHKFAAAAAYPLILKVIT